jgi:CRISPR-associated protein Cas2
MNRRSWYLLAYDIADPRRLKRVHAYLKKRGLAAQKSVFFVHFSPPELDGILSSLRRIIHVNQDDVRVYPIDHPAQVWLSGAQPVQAEALLDPGRIGAPRDGDQAKAAADSAGAGADKTVDAAENTGLAQTLAVLPDWLKRLWRGT